MNLVATASQWMEDRLRVRSLAGRLFAGSVDARGAWLRTTGLCCGVLAGVLAATGLFLALFYSPSPDQAYASVKAIDGDAFGRFIRSFHSAASAGLIVVAALGVLRMLVRMEFLGNGDLLWLCSIATLLLALLGQITGHLLPWDVNAVATADVEAGLAGNAWVAGPVVKRLILGGATTGAGTLSRWYGAHLLLVPAGFALVGAIVALRRIAPPPAPDLEGRQYERYYPFHLARELAVSLGVVAGLAVWAALSSAPLGPEATSDNLAGFKAKSEWYVSPLHGLIFLPPFNQARFEPVATAVLPTLAVGLLAALPFLARREGSKLRRRGFVVSLAAAGAVGSGALAVYGGAMDRTAVLQPSADSRPPVDRKLVVAGVKLYDKLGCAGCHKINGVGGTICPDLSDEGKIRPDRQWQIDHLINPSSKVPGSTMPAYPDLKRHEVAALAEYMVSLFKKKPGQAAQR